MPSVHPGEVRKPTILFVTDLYYTTDGRPYAAEDIYLTSVLRESFSLMLCHPKDTEPFEALVDGIVYRNTGPVFFYPSEYEAFRRRIESAGIPIYNSLDGQADMRGKQYLVELTRQGFPVIPTIDTLAEWRRSLPETGERQDAANAVLRAAVCQ